MHTGSRITAVVNNRTQVTAAGGNRCLLCLRVAFGDQLRRLHSVACNWQCLPRRSLQSRPLTIARSQREYIMKRAHELGVSNLTVITADMVEFQVRLICVGLGNVALCRQRDAAY